MAVRFDTVGARQRTLFPGKRLIKNHTSLFLCLLQLLAQYWSTNRSNTKKLTKWTG